MECLHEWLDAKRMSSIPLAHWFISNYSQLHNRCMDCHSFYWFDSQMLEDTPAI